MDYSGMTGREIMEWFARRLSNAYSQLEKKDPDEADRLLAAMVIWLQDDSWHTKPQMYS